MMVSLSYNMQMTQYLSKWFYDISTDTATRAVHCGLLLEGLTSLELAVVDEAQWIRGFTWFRPLERNTLHPRKMVAILLCILQASVELA
jgi:hypothetical protein